MANIYFSLHNDIETYLINNTNNILTTDYISMLLMLFADDMAILGKSPEEIIREFERQDSIRKAQGTA